MQILPKQYPSNQCPIPQEKEYAILPKILANIVHFSFELNIIMENILNEICDVLYQYPTPTKITRSEGALYKVLYKDIPPALKREFINERAVIYHDIFWKGALDFYQKAIYGFDRTKEAIHIPSPDHVVKLIKNTVLSKEIKENSDGSFEVCFEYFEKMNELILDDITYEIDCAKVRGDNDISFHSIYGNTYNSLSPKFDLAIMNFLSGAVTYMSHIDHPKSHFQFSDIVSALTFDMKDGNSVLFQLLSPHTRNSLFINEGVLEHHTLPFGSRSGVKSLIHDANPFMTMPVDIGDLRKLLGEIMQKESEPKDFFYPKCTAKTNFCNQLHDYYDIVKKFAHKVGDYIGDIELENFADNLSKYQIKINSQETEFNREKVLDFITYFIYTVSFLHSIEHSTFWGGYYYKEGVKDFRLALSGDRPITLGDFKKPIHLISNEESIYDIVIPKSTQKFKNLSEFYTRYHVGEKNYSMSDIDYKFETEKLRSMNKEFVDEINVYSEKLASSGELLAHAIAQSISW